jgi:hypothetical protein
LKKAGVRVSLVQPPSEEKAQELGVGAAIVAGHPSGGQLAEIAKIIDSGNLAPKSIASFRSAKRAAHTSINGTSVRIRLPPLRLRHGGPGSIEACGGESTWWRRDSIIYDCAEEETSRKIHVKTLKLLSFPTDLADGAAYVEAL